MFLQRLPLEIRLLIYEQYFFGGQGSCRVFQPSWVGTAGCTSPSTSTANPAAYPIRANITALPLILTCRQMYDYHLLLTAHWLFQTFADAG